MVNPTADTTLGGFLRRSMRDISCAVIDESADYFSLKILMISNSRKNPIKVSIRRSASRLGTVPSQKTSTATATAVAAPATRVPKRCFGIRESSPADFCRPRPRWFQRCFMNCQTIFVAYSPNLFTTVEVTAQVVWGNVPPLRSSGRA